MDPVNTLARPAERRGLMRADLAHAPGDGHRYELIDGELLVTPAPGYRHQVASLRLAVLLHQHCPPDLTVLAAPFAVGLAEDTEVQPDLLVAPRADFTDKDLPGAPTLVVEILSASTRRIDTVLKRQRYQRARIPSYWVLDPARPGPHLTVHELVDDAYVVVAEVGPDASWTATAPFPLTISPGNLVD